MPARVARKLSGLAWLIGCASNGTEPGRPERPYFGLHHGGFEGDGEPIGERN